MGNAFVVLNPATSTKGSEHRLCQHLSDAGWTVELYTTTGEECVAEVVRARLDGPPGVDMVVAAGGDGTVSGAADGVAQTDVPLGIVPLGTGDTFARELGIPLDSKAALDLMTGDHSVAEIDAMAVGDRFFVLNVSIGISGLMMRDTARVDKRRFGRMAYVWTGLKKLFGYQPHQFVLSVDGEDERVIRASEIAIVNSGALGDPSLRWSPQVELDDGRIDLCVVRARSILDYLSLALAVILRRHREEPGIRHRIVEREVVVDTQSDLPVQADGEYIGAAPVEVAVVPGAVRVVVP